MSVMTRADLARRTLLLDAGAKLAAAELLLREAARSLDHAAMGDSAAAVETDIAVSEVARARNRINLDLTYD